MSDPSSSQRRTDWPARYYGVIDPQQSAPQQIRGWFDAWNPHYTDESFPPKDAMHPLTEEQWAWHLTPGQSQAQLNEDGSLSPYIPPPPSLPQQAKRVLLNYGIAAGVIAVTNGDISPEMRDYLKKLIAILNGSDTTSTTLPSPPALPKEFDAWLTL